MDLDRHLLVIENVSMWPLGNRLALKMDKEYGHAFVGSLSPEEVASGFGFATMEDGGLVLYEGVFVFFDVDPGLGVRVTPKQIIEMGWRVD